MVRSLWVTLILAAPGFAAQANDAMESTLKSRALASASASVSPAVSALAQAPFTQARDPLHGMMLRDEQHLRVSRGTCQHSARDLCYDLLDGRLTYRPVRRYMPRIDGLTPESVSVRHNRVTFKYSFR
jgi:hypothetical protein